jgi:hypothetical protein
LKITEEIRATRTYESRRVVVLHRLGISERLKNGIRLQQLLLQLTLLSKHKAERNFISDAERYLKVNLFRCQTKTHNNSEQMK